jgi:type IV pilus assembly protein PilQ
MSRAWRIITALLALTGLVFSLAACQTTESVYTPDETLPNNAVVMQKVSDPDVVAGPRITGIETKTVDGKTQVLLKGLALERFSAKRENQPPTLIVDVEALADGDVLGDQGPQNPMVNRLLVKKAPQRDNVHRVIVGLALPSKHRIDRRENGLAIILTPGTREAREIMEQPLTVTRPGDGGLARIKAVEFKPLDQTGRTRLIIDAAQPIEPQVKTKDNGRTVVLSLAPARLPKKLQGPLNTMYFKSAVNFIKPAQTAPNRAEFFIRLRETAPYHVSQKDGLIMVDFDPSNVEHKTPLKPAPGVPAVPAVPAAASGQAPAGGTVPAPPRNAAAGPEKAKVTKAAYTPPAQATEAEAGEARDEMEQYADQKRISLDFQDAEIRDIIRLIGDVSGYNVVVSQRVGGKVTIKMDDVPWGQALDIILESNNLDMVQSGNVIRVDTVEFFQQQKNAEIETRKSEKELKALEPPIRRSWTPNYAEADGIASELQQFMQSIEEREGGQGQEKASLGQVKSIGGRIYVEAREEVMDQLEAIFFQLDKPVKQILIETRIVEATNNFTRQLGINWGGQEGAELLPGDTVEYGIDPGQWNFYGAHGGAGPTTPDGAAVNLMNPVGFGLALGVGVIAENFSLDAQLYAMETAGDGRVVSAPRVMARDGQDVYIKQGREIPYQSFSLESGPTTEFKEAALELRVKPQVQQNNKIISLDVTVIKDQVDEAAAVENPPINTNEAQTKLMVRDGETVVIGGIITDEMNKSQNRVPGLHRVPLLGWMFKNNNISNRKVELLIFLTSHIIPVKFAE